MVPTARLRAGCAAAVTAMAIACGPRAWARAVVPDTAAHIINQSDSFVSSPLGPQGGTLDWTARRLCFDSHSAGPIGAYLPPVEAPYAQRRAESLAQNGLIALLRTLVLGPPDSAASPPQTVGDRLAADANLSAVVFAAVQNMQVYQSVYGADGSVSLQVMLPLDNEQPGLGALWAALQSRAAHADPAALGQPPSPAAAPQAHASQTAHAATGIIINARGTGYVPSLWPRIVVGSGVSFGATVYGPHMVPIDVLLLRGVMGTTRSLEAAMSDPRVAPVPIVLRAQSRPGQDPYTLLLSEDDAQVLAQARDLLADARVICVVD